MRSRSLAWLALPALLLLCAAALAGAPVYTTGSYFGGSADDEFAGVAFAPDGTIVAVANTASTGAISGVTPTVIGADGTVASTAIVARYSNDGRTLLSLTRFGWGIFTADDVAVDGTGIYVIGRASAAYQPLIAGLGGIDTTAPASGKKPAVAKLDLTGATLIRGTYLAGSEQTTDRQTLDFFSDGDVAVTHTSGNDSLSRLSNDLTAQRWTVAFGTRAGTCRIQHMAVSRTDDMVYVIGYGMGSTTQEPLKGPFAYQFNGSGVQQWQKANTYYASYNFSPREGDGRLNGLISDSTGQSCAVDSAGQPLFTYFADGGATVLGKDPDDWTLGVSNQDGDGWWGCSGATSLGCFGRMDTTTHQWTRCNVLTPRGADNKVQGSRVKDLCAAANDYVFAVGWAGNALKGINPWYLNLGGGFILKANLASTGTVRMFITQIPSVGGFNAVARQGTTNRFAVVGYASATGAPCPYGVQTTLGGAKDGFLVVMDDDPSTTFDAPPSVSVSSPANNTVIAPGSNLTINASASDNGTVTKVEFYQGSTKLGEDTTSPFSYVWNSVPTGAYQLRAVATDNGGSTACSIPINVKADYAPTVGITSPANGASIAGPASITIQATAADSDGTVAKVEFYQGSTKLGEDTTSPFSYTWFPAWAGSYSLTAKATDDLGVATTSAAVSITVGSGPLPAEWTNANVGTGIAAALAGYNSGQYVFEAAGSDIAGTADSFNFTYQTLTGDGTVIARVVSQENTNSTAKAGIMIRGSLDTNAMSAYVGVTPTSGIQFIRRTTVGGSASSTSASGFAAPYWVKLVRAGSVFSAYRSPDGVVWTQVGSNVTIAMGSTTYVGLAIASRSTTTLCTVAYDNVSVVSASAPNVPPAVSITVPTAGAVFTAPATVVVTANATDSDGTVTRVEFYQGATKIGEDTVAPFSIDWTSVAAGSYSLTATAFDDDGASTTSSPAVSIIVNAPPTVSITDPLDGATFTAPATIIIAASASDADGSVTTVEFYQGSTKLGEATAAPFTYTWSNVPVGTYALTAVATDSRGATTTSAPVWITVASPWQSQDIGSVGVAGSFSESAGTFTVAGSGADIWGTADAFRFGYQTVTGDCTITARVVSVQNTNSWAKAGVMIRAGLAANAAHAMTAVTPGNGVAFQRRTTTGGTSANTNSTGKVAPYWVRVRRVGSSLSAWMSPDNVTWTQLGTTTTISMTDPVYVGLAVTSHSNSVLCTSVFDNVSITTP